MDLAPDYRKPQSGKTGRRLARQRNSPARHLLTVIQSVDVKLTLEFKEKRETNMTTPRLALILGAAFVVGTVPAARAGAILYDNLGTGSTVYATPYSAGFWLINSATGGYGGAGLTENAFAFTPAVTANLTELDIALGLITGSGSVTVDLVYRFTKT